VTTVIDRRLARQGRRRVLGLLGALGALGLLLRHAPAWAWRPAPGQPAARWPSLHEAAFYRPDDQVG
jgi:hypothetical protein